MGERRPLGESEIIARFFAPLATDPAALGLRDDAAVLTPPAGKKLVVTTDAVIEGIHFLPDDPPDSIGHKALAVNLSDLAAKGAEPLAYLMALALPRTPTAEWLAAFAGGLETLQVSAAIALVGGDTTATPGPLTVAITAFGTAPDTGPVLRSGARPRHGLYVTGTIGDAWLGLQLLREPASAESFGLRQGDAEMLIDRYRRPRPRLEARPALAYAEAAMDVSDGLLGDLQKLCRASGVGATIGIDRVPLSPAAARAVSARPDLLPSFVTGGDDYELLIAVAEAESGRFLAAMAAAGLPSAHIGEIVEGDGAVVVVGPDGAPLSLAKAAYDHFADG